MLKKRGIERVLIGTEAFLVGCIIFSIAAILSIILVFRKPHD